VEPGCYYTAFLGGIQVERADEREDFGIFKVRGRSEGKPHFEERQKMGRLDRG